MAGESLMPTVYPRYRPSIMHPTAPVLASCGPSMTRLALAAFAIVADRSKHSSMTHQCINSVAVSDAEASGIEHLGF